MPDNGLMSSDDKRYFIKYGLCLAAAHFGITFAGVSALLEWKTARMNKSAQKMLAWSKKADQANEMLNDLFKVQRMKEDYNRQGIKATED